MSYVVLPFEVSSRAFEGPVKCRFVHLLAGVATRHADTIDCIFLVDGQKVVVAISCPAIAALGEELRQQGRAPLSDQQLAEIAALFLRRTLEQGLDPTQAELSVGAGELGSLSRELDHP